MSRTMLIAQPLPTLSEQIIAKLREDILAGTFGCGEKLPSEKELSEMFSVSQSTIKKCLAALKRENLLVSLQGKGYFVPSPSKKKKTGIIGAVLFSHTHITHPVMSQRLAGLEKEIACGGHSLALYCINDANCSAAPLWVEKKWYGVIDPSMVDGIIIMCLQAQPDQILQLNSWVPVCVTDRNIFGPHMASVRLDLAKGIFLSTQHLIELGHRRIAYIGLDKGVDNDTHNAFRLAFSACDTACGDIVSMNTYRREVAAETFGSYLTEKPVPTGIICGSHEIALGVYEVLRQNGLEVPKDVSLIVTSDVLTDSDIPVPLTCLSPAYSESGRECVREIMDLIEHPDKPREEKFVPCKLIVRDSTAPLK